VTAPTFLLVLLAICTGSRARYESALRPASKALDALALLDLLRCTLAPAVATWCAGEPISEAQRWAVRLDGVLVAGVWPGVVAWLLVASAGTEERRPAWLIAASLAYGTAAVATARIYPAAWLGLLVAPRFGVGALAWRGKCGPHVNPCTGSLVAVRIGQLVAAFEVAGVAFLWSHWRDVHVLSCACWVACGWVVVRYGR
jgi:hypothetical protein